MIIVASGPHGSCGKPNICAVDAHDGVMVPWCPVGRVCDVPSQQTRASCALRARQPAWAASPAGMEIELNGTVAVLEPRLGRVGGFAVDGVWCVQYVCDPPSKKKVNSSLLNLAIGCHQADRPRLITAASHQHEDDPGRKSRLVPSI
jgi:hypothetical protein